MTDFFISYNGADRDWAEWIAFILEEAGFSTILQAWDFRPGSNFVLEMQNAAATAERTIMVLSPDYLNSGMAAAEWASAFSRDPKGLDRTIVPIIVRTCDPSGLLPSIVQIRIVGLGEEVVAREAILAGVDKKRAKPSNRPSFPGASTSPIHADFPGPEVAPTRTKRRRLPELTTSPTDADRRRFAKGAFNTIRATFKSNLEEIPRENSRLDFDITDVTATDFRAEIYVDGARRSQCRIWLGGMMGENNICFSEGFASDNSCNEIITPSRGEELHLSATMAMGFSEFERNVDMKRLSPEQAANYLWERFTSRLS